MKRLAPLLAAALLALTACTPAASEAPAEAAPSTTEETAAEPATPAGKLHSVYESTRVVGNAVYEVIPTYDAQWNPTGTIVYKTDLSAGQTTELYQADGYYSSMPLVTADTLYLTNANNVLALPLDGGAPRTMPVDAGEWETWLYNDRYLYYLTLSLAPYTRTQGMRLDLQTGETEPWDIPAETTAVFAPLGDSLLTTRIVSDRPVPFPDDPEMSEAFLQNSEREYDITDATTGKPVKKLLSYPWYGQPDGDGLLSYSCIGTSGEDIYFCVEHLLPFEDSYRLDGLSLLCIHSDGTQTDLGMLPGNLCEAIPQGDDLRWIVSGSFEEYIIYDLQGQEIGRNRLPAEKGASSVTLLRLLDDGRLLLSVGYDADHNNVMRFATIDADAFLNGSTNYQEIAFAE